MILQEIELATNSFQNLDFVQTVKSSSDALDGLLGADRWGVIEAVLNSSFQKRNVQAKVFLQIIASQNGQKLTCRPYFGMIPIPFRIKKPCPDRQNHQNAVKTLKFNKK